ncbi:hypothetical protein ACFP50_22295, partial [Streptomyces pratens]
YQIFPIRFPRGFAFRVPAFALSLSGDSDFIRSFAPNLPVEFFRFIERGFVEILDLEKQSDNHGCRCGSKPGSKQLFKSTSPLGPCQRFLWGEEETSS